VAHADPLDGARLRNERAREHLTQFRREIETIYEHFSRHFAGTHPETGGYAVMFPEVREPPPALAVIFGETIYNLRAALDYVVFELATHDSGVEQEGTQFPIEDREDVFRQTRRTTYLKGLSEEHIALIESYQPYKGCDWTGTLRRLSNPDKHRKLHLLVSELDPDVAVSAGWRFDAKDLSLFDPGDADAETRREQVYIGRSRHVEVQLTLAVSVTVADGIPAVETLEQVEREVDALIKRFRPLFD